MDVGELKETARYMIKGNMLKLLFINALINFLLAILLLPSYYIAFKILFLIPIPIINFFVAILYFSIHNAIFATSLNIMKKRYYLRFIDNNDTSFKDLFSHKPYKFDAYIKNVCSVLLYRFTLGYYGAKRAVSLVRYIRAENPNMGINKSLNENLRETKEQIELLEGLGYCFVGWILLVPLTFGLILIYLIPYMETTYALFYRQLNPLKDNTNVLLTTKFDTPAVATVFEPRVATGKFFTPIEEHNNTTDELISKPKEEKISLIKDDNMIYTFDDDTNKNE